MFKIFYKVATKIKYLSDLPIEFVALTFKQLSNIPT